MIIQVEANIAHELFFVPESYQSIFIGEEYDSS